MEPSKPSSHPYLVRQVAIAGVILAISLAVISMTLLAILLLPQILPTLFPSQSLAMLPNPMHSAIQSARAAWIAGDADAFAALFTETGEFVVPGQVYRGLDQIRAVTAAFSTGHSEVQIEIHRMITEGNQVAVEWHWEDTETATGKRMVADDAIMVDFENSKVRRWREYIDAA